MNHVKIGDLVQVKDFDGDLFKVIRIARGKAQVIKVTGIGQQSFALVEPLQTLILAAPRLEDEDTVRDDPSTRY